MSTRSNEERDATRAAKQAARDFRYNVAGAIVVFGDLAEKASNIILLCARSLVKHEGGRFVFFAIMKSDDPEVMEARWADLFAAAESLKVYNEFNPKEAVPFSLALAALALSKESSAASLVGPVIDKGEGVHEIEAWLTSGVPTNTNAQGMFSTPRYAHVLLTVKNGYIVRVLETTYGCYFRTRDGVEGRVPVIEPVTIRRPYLKGADDAKRAELIAAYEKKLEQFPNGIIQREFSNSQHGNAVEAFEAASKNRAGCFKFDSTVWGELLDAVEEQCPQPKKSAAAFVAGAMTSAGGIRGIDRLGTVVAVSEKE